MSLSVLKRKSSTKHLSSRGENGFSLNNPRRVYSKSGKGQTQTPMKGTALRGHGSCCGKFPIRINKSQYVNYDNHVRDFSSDKMNQGISVKNHHGSMAIRHKWLKRGYPHYIVKTTRQTDYDTYHDNLHKQSALQNDGETAITQDSCEGNSCNKKTSDIVKNVGPLTHSEYLKSKYLQKRCLPTPVSKLHSPVPINGPCNSCGNGNENQAVSQSKGVICE